MAGSPGAHIRSNAVAYAALFVALGGTSYAATLPRNSVGNRQLKSNAVTSAKIRNGAVRSQDLAGGVVRRGQRGPEGPAGSIADGLPSGKTLRGRFEAGDGTPAGNAAGDVASEAISFGAQLTAPPARTIVMNPPGPPQCPGTVADPQAAPGHLCIYVGDRVAVAGIDTITEAGPGATSRHGAGIYVTASAAGTFGARGSWAVTAP